MMETEGNKERNLRDLKQIGTPRENNKIYIENLTYNKIKENYQDKRVFVLMGHTERMGEKYATFIEAAISVSEIAFVGNLPRWENDAWSEVFREIKRLYEDMIIVGWTVDIRGMAPKMTPELERIHREHFGGVHQLLLLLDTLQHEETFYIYKENKLVSKDGFYIYHRARCKEKQEPIKEGVYQSNPQGKGISARKDKGRNDILSQTEVDLDFYQKGPSRGGRYRQMILEQKKPQKDGGNIGIAIAVAILVLVIGVGVYESGTTPLGKEESVEVGAEQGQEDKETLKGENNEKEEDTETNADEIQIEVIPGKE